MTGGFSINSYVMGATYPTFESSKINSSSTVAMLGGQAKWDKPVKPYASISIGAQTKIKDNPEKASDKFKVSPISEFKTGCSIPIGESNWTINPQYRLRTSLDYAVEKKFPYTCPYGTDIDKTGQEYPLIGTFEAKEHSNIYSFQNRFSASFKSPSLKLSSKNDNNIYFYAAPSLVVNHDKEKVLDKDLQSEYIQQAAPNLSKWDSRFDIWGGVGVNLKKWNIELEAQGYNLISKKPSIGINATVKVPLGN